MALFNLGKKNTAANDPFSDIPLDQPAPGMPQAVPGQNPMNMPNEMPQNTMQDQSANVMPPPPPPEYAQQPQSSQTAEFQQQPQETPVYRQGMEEIAEAIIDEKWKDIVADINKIIEWKEKSEARIGKIEQDIKNIKENFNTLHKGVLGKITDYDQNITNVGVEIKAMEKVFQKIIPTFTENVNKLAIITRGMNKKIK